MDAKPPSLVGALAAITASLCCVVPLVLLTLGVGGAWVASLSVFEPLRPIFIAIALVMLILAWRKLYLPACCTADKVCANLHLQRHLSGVRTQQNRNYADRRLPVVLRMRGVPYRIETQARRLLRLLLIRHGALPPYSNAQRVLRLIAQE